MTWSRDEWRVQQQGHADGGGRSAALHAHAAHGCKMTFYPVQCSPESAAIARTVEYRWILARACYVDNIVEYWDGYYIDPNMSNIQHIILQVEESVVCKNTVSSGSVVYLHPLVAMSIADHATRYRINNRDNNYGRHVQSSARRIRVGQDNLLLLFNRTVQKQSWSK